MSRSRHLSRSRRSPSRRRRSPSGRRSRSHRRRSRSKRLDEGRRRGHLLSCRRSRSCGWRRTQEHRRSRDRGGQRSRSAGRGGGSGRGRGDGGGCIRFRARETDCASGAPRGSSLRLTEGRVEAPGSAKLASESLNGEWRLKFDEPKGGPGPCGADKRGLSNKPAWMTKGLGINKEVFGETTGKMLKPGLWKEDLERIERMTHEGPDPWADIYADGTGERKASDFRPATSSRNADSEGNTHRRAGPLPSQEDTFSGAGQIRRAAPLRS